MRLASYMIRSRESYGVVVGDGIVDLRMRLTPRYPTLLDVLRAEALDEVRAVLAGVRPDFPLAEAELRPPVPGGEKILCIGINYADRPADYGDTEPKPYPSMFFRTPGSLVGHNQPIVRPPESEQLDYEGEIALVIGKTGRRIPKERALSHVVGLTLCNEGTIRDWLRHSKFNVTQGKNFERSGSLGPWIVTSDELDPASLMQLTTKVNGELRQNDNTRNLIYPFVDIISYVSTFMELKPGDVITTGTPVGAGSKFDPPKWLKPGDVVEISVPEIGTLRNQVVDER